MKKSAFLGATSAFLALMPLHAASAATATATMHLITKDGTGQAVGTVTIREAAHGIVLEPDLKGLPPGQHGFHVHQNPDCGPGQNNGQTAAGFAAGGHFDPAGTGKHLGPQGAGHLGDLPVLVVVNASGVANQPIVAPRLSLKDVQGRTLMIHEGGDNYSDEPKPLGGGGGRIACGLIK
jgi:Cu-Zn family superoxide dismutase